MYRQPGLVKHIAEIKESDEPCHKQSAIFVDICKNQAKVYNQLLTTYMIVYVCLSLAWLVRLRDLQNAMTGFCAERGAVQPFKQRLDVPMLVGRCGFHDLL